MFTLSASAYQVLWEMLSLPPMPIELMVPPQGIEEHERRAVVDTALEELRANGFLDHEGLTEALWVLAQPQYTVDTRWWAGRHVRALAARVGSRAVLGVLADDVFSARWIEPNGLVREVVSLLPPLIAARGQSVSVPSKTLGAAASVGSSSDWAFVDALTANGVPGNSARQLVGMIEGRCNGAQFGASMAEHNGKMRRADRVVACFDTPRGRYLVEEQQGWTTVAPTDAHRLGVQIDRLLADLNAAVVSRSRPSGSR